MGLEQWMGVVPGAFGGGVARGLVGVLLFFLFWGLIFVAFVFGVDDIF